MFYIIGCCEDELNDAEMGSFGLSRKEPDHYNIFTNCSNHRSETSDGSNIIEG